MPLPSPASVYLGDPEELPLSLEELPLSLGGKRQSESGDLGGLGGRWRSSRYRKDNAEKDNGEKSSPASQETTSSSDAGAALPTGGAGAAASGDLIDSV